jgi:hypothetical protein
MSLLQVPNGYSAISSNSIKSRIALFDGKSRKFIQTGGKNFYEIVNFFKACLQVNAPVRLEKNIRSDTPHPFPLFRKRYFLI